MSPTQRKSALIIAIGLALGNCLGADANQAQRIYETSGIIGGLVVHLGCGEGQLTGDLHVNERLIVQGLDPNAKNIEAARKQIQSRDLYGKVSVRHWDRDHLPYGDNLVNLIVVSKNASGVPEKELRRVLAPRGVLLRKPDALSAKNTWTKPVPEEIDDWTHYLHNPGNNAVAEDDRVGPPNHLQWKAGPLWSRSHEFASSVHAMVSANGRLISIMDEGIIGQPRGVPALWTLIARDAFNGIRLWRLPCDPVNQHALATVGDKVYVTLKRRAPLSILDAATGETLQLCEETGRVEELAVLDGKVVLNTQLPVAKGKYSPHIAAADAETGRLLWKTPVELVLKNGFVAGKGRVCYSNGKDLVCLSLADGKEQWRTPVEGKAGKKGRHGYLVLFGDAVYMTGGSTRAFSLEAGKLLWRGPDGSPHARNPPGLFGANGLIWTAWGHVDPRSFLWQHREEVRNGFDPLTGEVRKTVQAERLVTAGHHIRCYPPKATRRYLLLNKRGVEFFDLQGDNHMRANWARGACGFGMLPANGFLYTPPGQCFCYQGVLLTGLNALSETRERTAPREPASRLEKGPAFSSVPDLKVRTSATDWPTYRHDPRRSGSIDTLLPAKLERLWETPLCDPAFPRDPEEETAAEEEGFVLRALDATIHGSGARKDSNAVVAWKGKDTYITWETKLEKTGRQTVWISQSNQMKGGSTFELAIGDEKLTGTIRKTDNWNQYVWHRVGEVDISTAGKQTITLEPLEQVDGRLGNVAAVAIGGSEPPSDFGGSTPPQLRPRPPSGLTPPVAAEGKVFVAEPDMHSVYALDGATGERLWTFVADGRVDSPPTIHDGLCLFGSTDGHVYCVTAEEGELAWRFRAAPEERQICSMGQVESAWPVHGSVLVREEKVYCTAGRSSHLDGGIRMYALNPRNGEIVYETLLKSEDPDVSTYGGRPFDMEGSKSDILVGGKEDVYLFQERFTLDLTRRPMERVTKLGDRMGEPRLITTDGFLDKTWFNRTYWLHDERWPGYYFTYRAPKSGQIVVFDDENTYALKVYTERRGHSPEFAPGSGYQLTADRNTTRPVLDVMDIGAEKGRGYSRTELPVWSEKVPIRAHGMLLARHHLYLAGPPDLAPEDGAYEAMIGKKGAVFRTVSATDGSTLAEFEIDEVPVFDGLIGAGGRLYMTTMDGTLICFGEKE